ncbi:hypothetical protein HHL16_10980 [Pseudoflavitalea sp. G-6-1-2]|uniref:hypothetical protein n=1 Tax=Pseudoflavitalea sp. G-6-1-2 TaxID=2728841 RepID=UPI00146D4472|nr:hypothetical protein [Pseudoflavitalea sp. G-6-1-2]NML21401.1 hypothetical protein [Pseudoflavitalea sp. G-6-1-2]
MLLPTLRNNKTTSSFLDNIMYNTPADRFRIKSTSTALKQAPYPLHTASSAT